MTQEPEVPGSVWLLSFVSPSGDAGSLVVSCWRMYMYLVLINHFGGLSLPRNSVVRLTDRPDMTIAVYHGHKATKENASHSEANRLIYSTEIKNATLNLSNILFLMVYVNYIPFNFLSFQTLTFTVLEIQSCLSNG